MNLLPMPWRSVNVDPTRPLLVEITDCGRLHIRAFTMKPTGRFDSNEIEMSSEEIQNIMRFVKDATNAAL